MSSSDLGRRIGLTIGALLVVRLGTCIPVPGIEPMVWRQLFRQDAYGILTMLAVGAVWLALVYRAPEILVANRSVAFYLGGTSLLILVCAILDVKAQFDQAHGALEAT